MYLSHTINDGRDGIWCVTPEGQAVVRTESPTPKKRTRIQLRYEAYLNGCGDMKFGEWLKMQKHLKKL